MEAPNHRCHCGSGTCHHGTESRHILEGVWKGFYGNNQDIEIISVHTVKNATGEPFLFGTKLVGDNYIPKGWVTFWFRSGDGSFKETLEGEGHYASPSVSPGEYCHFFLLFLSRCFWGYLVSVLLIFFFFFFLLLAEWVDAKLYWNSNDSFVVEWTKYEFCVQFMRYQTVKAERMCSGPGDPHEPVTR